MKTKRSLGLDRVASFGLRLSDLRSQSSPAGSRTWRSRVAAFTLLELLTVIAIIGILAALAMPVMRNFKPNYTASLSRQLLDDLARARQLAISQHTTVFMVFVPTNFWFDPAYGKAWTATDFLEASNLLDKQLVGYNFVSLRSMGDQPGRPTVHYLSSWRTLPEGGFIHPGAFAYSPTGFMTPFPTNAPGQPLRMLYVPTMKTTAQIPWPSEATPKNPNSLRAPYVRLPYIGFDYLGRLVGFDSQNRILTTQELGGGSPDVILPLVQGAAVFARGGDRRPQQGAALFLERPPGNYTNSYNLVYVDWLTGRAHMEHQEVK